MYGRMPGVIIYSKFRRNPFRVFGAPEVEICPFPLLWLLAFTTACTVYRANREKGCIMAGVISFSRHDPVLEKENNMLWLLIENDDGYGTPVSVANADDDGESSISFCHRAR